MAPSHTLHCLGTAGYHPNETRQTSCYFLPELGIVLDAGTGIFRLPSLIQTDHLDILLSHAHLDHVIGLTFLLDILHQRPVARVTIWGQRSKIEGIQTHLFSEALFPVKLDVQWRSIDPTPTLELTSARATWREQPHPGGSVAFAIEPIGERTDPRPRLVYATDTTGEISDEAFAFLGTPSLLLHECNFRSDQQRWAETTGHCHLDRVLQIVDRCGAPPTVLTHLNPIDELVPDDIPGWHRESVQIAADRSVYRW